jgi:hypothetical protein
MKPKVKAPITKRLKLRYDAPLSNFAFKFELRRYAMAAWRQEPAGGSLRKSSHSADVQSTTQARASV